MNDQTELRNQQLAEMQEELNAHAMRLGIAKKGLQEVEDAKTLGEWKKAADEALEALEAVPERVADLDVEKTHNLQAEDVEIHPDALIKNKGDKLAKVLAQARPVPTVTMDPTANRKERRRKAAMARRAKGGRGYTKSFNKTRNRKKR